MCINDLEKRVRAINGVCPSTEDISSKLECNPPKVYKVDWIQLYETWLVKVIKPATNWVPWTVIPSFLAVIVWYWNKEDSAYKSVEPIVVLIFYYFA